MGKIYIILIHIWSLLRNNMEKNTTDSCNLFNLDEKTYVLIATRTEAEMYLNYLPLVGNSAVHKEAYILEEPLCEYETLKQFNEDS